MRRVTALFLAILLPAIATGPVLANQANQADLRASPSAVKFGVRPVGSITLKGTRLTNRSSAALEVLVTAVSQPDDFSFGLLPGSTCPVLAPAPLAPGESCEAVVQFRPTDFFAGHRQTTTLMATARDPVTGTEVATLLIDFTGTGR